MDSLLYFSPQRQVFPFYEWQTIRLSWKKRLPKGIVHDEDSRQVFVCSSLVSL